MNGLWMVSAAAMAAPSRWTAARISFITVLFVGIGLLLILLFGYYTVVDARARARANLRQKLVKAVGRVATAAEAGEVQNVKVALPEADTIFNRRGIAVVTEVFDQLNEEGRAALRAILLKAGGAEQVRRQMSTDNEDYLVELVRLVGDLQLADLADKLVELIYGHRQNIDIQYYAFRSLARLGDGGRIAAICMDEEFVQALSFRSLQQVLGAYTGDVQQLCGALLAAPDHYIIRICLKRIGADRMYDLAEKVLPFLKNDDKNLVIDAIRALGLLQYAPAAEAIRPFAADKRWEVRAIAITALAVLDADGSEDVLITALQDSEWQVRYNAGSALRYSKHPDAVREKVLASGDKYALEMLEYMNESAKIWRRAQ